MTRPILRAVPIVVLLLVGGTLRAAPVRGEDIPLNVDANGTPTDPKIAEVERLVHVTYHPASPLLEPIDGPIVIDMQCTSRVYRSDTTGFLTFEYFWDAVGGPLQGFGEEQSIGSASDFTGFAINGFGIVETNVRREIITDSSGAAPGVGSTGQGGDLTPPRLVLATNATHFDENGSATAHGGDEALLHVIGTNQDKLDLVVGDMEVNHVFEPAAATIPLPAGVYPASLLLGIMLVAYLARGAGRKIVAVAVC